MSFEDPPTDDGWSFCNHRAMTTGCSLRLVLFDVDGTLVDHEARCGTCRAVANGQ